MGTMLWLRGNNASDVVLMLWIVTLNWWKGKPSGGVLNYNMKNIIWSDLIIFPVEKKSRRTWLSTELLINLSLVKYNTKR